MDALSFYKYIKREPTRFVNLVETLKFAGSKSEHEKQILEIKVKENFYMKYFLLINYFFILKTS